VPDIGRKFSEDINLSQLRQKFVTIYLNVAMIDTYNSHRSLLMYREGVFDFKDTQLKFDIVPLQNESSLENLIKLLETHVATLFAPESPDQEALTFQTFSLLPDSIQQVIFYRTW
jgi:hypothetical protein